jgi:hypothetical protein
MVAAYGFTLLIAMCPAAPAFAQSPAPSRVQVSAFVGAINFREAIHEKPVTSASGLDTA